MHLCTAVQLYTVRLYLATLYTTLATLYTFCPMIASRSSIYHQRTHSNMVTTTAVMTLSPEQPGVLQHRSDQLGRA